VNYVFANPDKVMVGVRGEVGNRLFLLQVREGRRLVIIKCEKAQLSALAEWLGAVIGELGRPGHLPEDLSLEPEYEEAKTLEVTFESLEDDHTMVLTLNREWASALAIAITRLVEAGRPACPLCGGPLDPHGHDCPRTNGHRPPIR
jgi:hypothetical protein